MNSLSICIADNDAIRAETIKETLIEEGYSAVAFKTEVNALRAIVENKYDIIFFSHDISADPFGFVNKIKDLSPKSHMVVINSISQNIDIPPLMFAEMGIKHYIDTPITSMNYVLDRIHEIEAEIIREEDKLSLQETPYYDVIRILGSIYEEGMLELTNESERALIIIKGKAVVSAYVTPGVRGVKAFLRIAEWSNGHFSFKNKITGSYGVEHDIAYVELIRLCTIAKKAYEWFLKSRNNLPEKNINLQINTKIKERNIPIAPKELDVLMTVIDHNKISEILNYNSSLDTDIYESLISLRKKGVIEVGA
ncbi:MAG: DUF4388 domain-containing protein [Proteobacteria bacterium]|nr:DUF4388 domain-containing protein [Pseudomonadota bacterium]